MERIEYWLHTSDRFGAPCGAVALRSVVDDNGAIEACRMYARTLKLPFPIRGWSLSIAIVRIEKREVVIEMPYEAYKEEGENADD